MGACRQRVYSNGFKNYQIITSGQLRNNKQKMNPLLKNVLAILAGIVLGGMVNMMLIMISTTVIPPPAGADVTTIDGLIESMHLFEPKHFVMPFLAHALGTFVGAFICALIAANNKLKLALLIGLFFFAGGITNIYLLPSPLWFTVLDLVVAYIPMAWLGGMLALRLTSKNNSLESGR